MIKQVFNVFLISSIVIGFAFVFFTLISKRGRDKSIIYLNLVVVFLILNYLQIILIDNVFTNVNYFVKTLRIPFYVLILPAFYTFVTYYLNIERKIKSFVVLSAILFFIELIFRIILYKLYYKDDENYTVAYYRQIEEIINVVFSLFLFVKAYFLLFKRTVLYQEILTFDNIKWLKKFMLIATVIMFSWILAVIFNLDKVLHPQTSIYFPLRLSCSVLVFWLAYEGFFNYSLLSERIQLRKVIETNKNKKKTISNKVEIDSKCSKYKIIKEHIEANSSYLNPEFSLENLSSELKMSTSTLSQAINNESNTNFSDYINSLRVEKAKDFLIAPEYSSYTILAIGLECGFNSKSTFYSAFKKFTNCTPSEFRNARKNDLVRF